MRKPQIIKIDHFNMSIIPGGIVEFILGPHSTIDNLVESVAAGLIMGPAVDHYHNRNLNSTLTSLYRKAPFVAAGYMVGQTVVKYFF